MKKLFRYVCQKKTNLTSCEYDPLEITPYKVDPFMKVILCLSNKKQTKKQQKNNKNEQWNKQWKCTMKTNNAKKLRIRTMKSNKENEQCKRTMKTKL